MSTLGSSVNRVRLPPQSWCRGKAMASHHFSERCGVGRAASCGLDDGDHLAEVARAEDAGADDREHLRVDSMIVVEAVDDSPRNAQHLARADVGLSSVERPGQHALKPVDRLLVTVMAVCARHSGSGRDIELEDCYGTSRHLALEQESDRQLPDPDLFAWARHCEYTPRVLLSACLPMRRSPLNPQLCPRGYWLRRLVESAPQPLHASGFPRTPYAGSPVAGNTL